MKIFNLVLPAVCYSCRKRISSQRECLCPECKQKLTRKREYLFGEAALGERYFYKAVSLFNYDFRTRELLHDFKYRGIKEIGNFFSNLAVDALKKEYMEFINVDCVVSTPMHKVKQRQRTFNQANYLCKKIAGTLNIQDLSALITKTLFTENQSLNDLTNRTKNLQGTFMIKDKKAFEDKTVLLIDDVFTTGATANELSKVLRDSGASRVYVFIIASGYVKQRQTYNINSMRKHIKDYTRAEAHT